MTIYFVIYLKLFTAAISIIATASVATAATRGLHQEDRHLDTHVNAKATKLWKESGTGSPTTDHRYDALSQGWKGWNVLQGNKAFQGKPNINMRRRIVQWHLQVHGH